MAKLGYARVSTDTQDYAAQTEALRNEGCDKLFAEKASGKSADNRRELQKLLKTAQPGDVVVVTKLDRIARSSRDLHNLLHDFKERGIGFKSIDDTWCDTTTDVGRLLLAIMGGIAEFERTLIHKRCLAGIERAKAKGTKFGRPQRLSPSEKIVIAQRYAAGETLQEIANDYNVAVSTIHLAVGNGATQQQALVGKQAA